MQRCAWLLVLLPLLASLPSPGYQEEEAFLGRCGLAELVQKFRDKEIEIIPDLNNDERRVF